MNIFQKIENYSVTMVWKAKTVPIFFTQSNIPFLFSFIEQNKIENGLNTKTNDFNSLE